MAQALHLSAKDHDLGVIEFNSSSPAGISTTDHLQGMLDQADFAFLILTAEDEQATGEFNPRMNVVHEAGLFQGKLGFRKAILFLEEGCREFSNVRGLTHIPFARGKIEAQFHEATRVLKREKLIS
jgi:predicted nucleotide-binding protein